jgi:hypothetical protein
MAAGPSIAMTRTPFMDENVLYPSFLVLASCKRFGDNPLDWIAAAKCTQLLPDRGRV